MEILNFLMGLLVAAGVVALAVVVGIVALIAYGTRRVVYALKGQQYVPLLGSGRSDAGYEHLDVSAGADAQSISRVLKRFVRTEVVGRYAHGAIAALEDSGRKVDSFRSVLDSKFEPHSLSWEKFATASDSVADAVLRNCAAVANHVQTFDHAEYRRLERARKRSAMRGGTPLDQTQAEKLGLLDASLADLDALTASNDGLLVELGKLTAELGKLESLDSTADGDRVVEEIRALIDQTRYYIR